MLLTRQIAIFLNDHGIGRFEEFGTGGNIFINAMPSSPSEAIAIFATGGPSIDPRNEYAARAIQILIRTGSTDPRPGETMAQAVIDVLKGFNGGYLADGGNYIIDIEASQDGPNNIGQDDNRRYEFSQNFIVQIVKKHVVEPPEPTPEEPTPDPEPVEPPIEEPTTDPEPTPTPEPDPEPEPTPEPPREYTATDYRPINLALQRGNQGEYLFSWELVGPTPPDLDYYLIFASDIIVARVDDPEARETPLYINPGEVVYMCAVTTTLAEYYSDAVEAQ